MSEYIVKTTVQGNSIVQESGWEYDARSNLRGDIILRVVQLEDEGIKAALVRLGWTPPGSVPTDELSEAADAPAECRCERYGKGNPHWPCPVHAAASAQPKGEPVGTDPGGGHTKLTADVVAAVRSRYIPYCKLNGTAALAREFGVSQPVVSRIINGHVWKEVGGVP